MATDAPRTAGAHPALLRELVALHGTPLLVMDLGRVEQNVRRISAALRHHLGAGAEPNFAVKSCYLPGVLDTVRSAGWGVEVMSGFELDLVTRAGVPGRQVTLTGLGWGEATCRDAVKAGVGRYVVDSEADLLCLADAVRTAGAAPPDVLVRLNLADEVPESFLQPDGKLGRSGTAAFTTAVDAVRAMPELRFSGIHLHQFNRLTSTASYDLALGRLSARLRDLRRAGIRCAQVDIGGGVESLARLDSAGAPFEGFAEVMGRHLGQSGGTRVHVTEFGRAVVGDAGVAVGRVTAVKRSAERCWVVLDVPTNSLVPIPGAVFPPVPLEDTAGRPLERCSFTDGTGSPVGFAADVPWPAPEVGDLVCLTEAGAYTTVFTELWAAPLPTLITLDAQGAHRVREGAATTLATWHAWYADAAWRPGPPSTAYTTQEPERSTL